MAKNENNTLKMGFLWEKSVLTNYYSDILFKGSPMVK
jgi:hypothetical protein